MKKLLIVLGAFALVAGLALNASAACQSCKGDAGRVHMPTAITLQGSSTCTNPTFDYDGDPDLFPASYATHGEYGYCTNPDGTSLYNNSAARTRTARNMKLLFKICDCPTSALANELTNGYLVDGVGIRMSILTPGVFFAAPNVVPTNPTRFSTADLNGDGLLNDPDGSETDIALDVHATVDQACADNAYVGNMSVNYYGQTFGTVTYYRDENCLATEVRYPNAGANNCTALPTVNRSQALQSNAGEGYVISLADVLNKVSVWWIDVPPMGLDATLAKENSIVTLKVGLVGDRAGTICQGCLAFCECTWDIATIGCLSPSMSYAMRFPYVVQQTSPWGTGIAVTNLAFATVANPTANFIMTDSTGTIFRASVDMTGKAVWAWDLDSLITGASALAWTSTPAGRTPAAGFAWICVTGNFPMDGYSYLNDGIFGAGTLPRIDSVVCP